MPLTHLLMTLAVVFIWGTNFVVIKWGLAEFPPFLLATLRFAFCVVPWIFFFPRPAVAWGRLAAFGVLLGVGQFGLLYFAMRDDISPGLASLIVQVQVFFTIGMAMVLQGERLKAPQVLGLALAVAGIAVTAWHTAGEGQGSITLLGLVLVLGAAASWASANMVARTAGRVNVVAFLVWSSPFAVPPLLALAFAFHGPGVVADSLRNATWVGWSVVGWQSIGNTLFCYGVWNWLLARHPAATVTPSALLVPVFGFSSSAWLLGEALPGWKLVAAALVMGGLALNVLASRAVYPRAK